MTNIEIQKNEKDFVVTASGHSGYAPEGIDIVCSAITSLMMFISSASACAGGKLEEMRSGYTRIRLQRNEKTELIIEALIMTLDTMRTRYGKYIKTSVCGGDEKNSRSI